MFTAAFHMCLVKPDFRFGGAGEKSDRMRSIFSPALSNCFAMRMLEPALPDALSQQIGPAQSFARH